MDFDALRARVDDVVTGVAADITESILGVTDSVINTIEDAKAEAESYRSTNINFDGSLTPEEVVRRVQEKLASFKEGVTQAQPASAAGAGGRVVSEESLVRDTYKYLTETHPSYMSWSKEMEDYIVNSQWVSDKSVLFEDMNDLIVGRVNKKKD